MRRDGTLIEHWQDLRDAWWAEHGEPLVQPTWWFDNDDEGLPVLKESTKPTDDNQPLHPEYPPELIDPTSSLKNPTQEPAAEPDYASKCNGVNDGTHAKSTAASPTPDHISQGTQVDQSYTMPAIHHQETQTDTRHLRDNPFAPLSDDYYLQTSTTSSSSSSAPNHRFPTRSDRRPPPFSGGCQLCRRAAGQDA